MKLIAESGENDTERMHLNPSEEGENKRTSGGAQIKVYTGKDNGQRDTDIED